MGATGPREAPCGGFGGPPCLPSLRRLLQQEPLLRGTVSVYSPMLALQYGGLLLMLPCLPMMQAERGSGAVAVL